MEQGNPIGCMSFMYLCKLYNYMLKCSYCKDQSNQIKSNFMIISTHGGIHSTVHLYVAVTIVYIHSPHTVQNEVAL